MFQEREHIITPLSHRHIHDFCDYALLELKGKYIDHWENNLIFTANYLETSIRIHHPSFDTFSMAIQAMQYTPKTLGIGNTFRQLLSKTDEALIISKAAIYCIEYLTDRSRTRKDKKRHIRVPDMHRNFRKIRPWRWHRRQQTRDLARIPVLFERIPSSSSRNKISLTTYGRLFAKSHFFHHPKHTVHSRPWNHRRSGFRNGDNAGETLHEYCALVDYLSTILPRAGRFPPLILPNVYDVPEPKSPGTSCDRGLSQSNGCWHCQWWSR